MASPLPAARSAVLAAPARSAPRPKKRRKRARPPQPQTPRDFFDDDAHKLLTRLLIDRAASWQNDWLRPLHFYGHNSEPLWDEYAHKRLSGTTVRIAGRRVFIESLSLDLERALRLLTLPWHEETQTIDGHDPEDWRAGLAGALWRIGQLYREWARRTGAEQAQALLVQIMDSLWK
ncbi:MAG TPA: hypothetical protein VKT82_34350 [Ktedonobacterales bacterium]|nr:hypothetical protein [Ktedonobacterales bacterium]